MSAVLNKVGGGFTNFHCNDWATLTFTASMTRFNTNLALPLVWSVSDPARGTIRASGLCELFIFTEIQ